MSTQGESKPKDVKLEVFDDDHLEEEGNENPQKQRDMKEKEDEEDRLRRLGRTAGVIGLKPYIMKHKVRFYWAVFSSLVNKVFDLAPPILVGWVVDSVNGSVPSWIEAIIDSDDAWDVAIFLAVLSFIIFGIESLFQYFYTYSFMVLAQQIQHGLRLDVYDHIQHREMEFFSNHRLGDTLSRLNGDINNIERFVGYGFNALWQLIVTIVFSLVVLFLVSWQLAFIGIVPVPLIIWGSLYYHRLVEPRYKAVRETNGELTARLENSISGMLVIKSFTAEKFEFDRVQQASDAYKSANIHAVSMSSVYVPVIRVAVSISFSIVILLGAEWIIDGGKNGLSVGEFVLFSMLIQRVLWPLVRLGQVLDDFERSNSSCLRTFELLKSPSKIQNASDESLCYLSTDIDAEYHEYAKNNTNQDNNKSNKNNQDVSMNAGKSSDSKQACQGTLDWNNVYFKYGDEDSNLILKDFDLHVPAGQFVGICGTTGAGKSTLVKTLLRLYDVTDGSVQVDGLDVRNIELSNLRANISLVSQDVYIFHGSILENIAYGAVNASAEDVERVSKLAHFDDFVQTLPKKYDTLVGERGIKLSGGQRQRLSIARALLKDAPIVIFDEATSSVDTETERTIQTNMEQFIKDKTALVIAHRLSTIRHADRIVVLTNGQVAEDGCHEDLLLRKGVYHGLWSVQSGDIEEGLSVLFDDRSSETKKRVAITSSNDNNDNENNNDNNSSPATIDIDVNTNIDSNHNDNSNSNEVTVHSDSKKGQ